MYSFFVWQTFLATGQSAKQKPMEIMLLKFHPVWMKKERHKMANTSFNFKRSGTLEGAIQNQSASHNHAQEIQRPKLFIFQKGYR